MWCRHMQDLDFTAEVWFHAGTREWEDFDGRNYTFESLMSEDYIPRSRASGRKPDLLLLGALSIQTEVADLPHG